MTQITKEEIRFQIRQLRRDLANELMPEKYAIAIRRQIEKLEEMFDNM